MMMACTKPKLVAYFTYDCKVGNTYIWSIAQWGWITLKLEKKQCMWSTAKWSFHIILRHISEQTLNSETQEPRRGIAEDASVVGCNTL